VERQHQWPQSGDEQAAVLVVEGQDRRDAGSVDELLYVAMREAAVERGDLVRERVARGVTVVRHERWQAVHAVPLQQPRGRLGDVCDKHKLPE